MAKLDATGYLDKWGKRLNAATPEMTQGVKNVTQAPGVKAAAQADYWIQRINESKQVWAKAVASVSLADWQDAMINKGIGRIAAGVAQAQKTKVAAIEKLLNAVDKSTSSIQSMPRTTIEQRIQRSAAFQMAMHNNAPKRNA